MNFFFVYLQIYPKIPTSAFYLYIIYSTFRLFTRGIHFFRACKGECTQESAKPVCQMVYLPEKTRKTVFFIRIDNGSRTI